MKQTHIAAIDFDDTIAFTNFPEIKGIVPNARDVINSMYFNGWYIIINTCRSGENEQAVYEFLEKNNIKYNLINSNHPDLVRYFPVESRKISADVYIDDKNIGQVGKALDWISVYWQAQEAMDVIEPLLSKFKIENIT